MSIALAISGGARGGWLQPPVGELQLRSQCLTSAHPLLRRDPGTARLRESWPRAILSRGYDDFESSFLAVCQTQLCYKAIVCIDPNCCHYKFCNANNYH
jgi:hypothetical protein